MPTSTTNAFAPTDLWPVRFACDVSTQSPSATGTAVRVASDLLWALSGRQFGLTTVTLRPVIAYAANTPFPDAWLSWPGTLAPPPGAASYSGGYWGWPVLSCGAQTDIRLPAPVYSVTQVKVDGLVLPTTAYRVDDNRILVRTDGYAWPYLNAYSQDDTRPGTWSVTAQYGQPVPTGGEMAVGELACELLRGMGGEDCRLPRNVTSLVRQGVTITMPEPTQAFKDGLTGLTAVDRFIMTWNPGRLRARARTYSIDSTPPRRVGT